MYEYHTWVSLVVLDIRTSLVRSCQPCRTTLHYYIRYGSVAFCFGCVLVSHLARDLWLKYWLSHLIVALLSVVQLARLLAKIVVTRAIMKSKALALVNTAPRLLIALLLLFFGYTWWDSFACLVALL